MNVANEPTNKQMLRTGEVPAGITEAMLRQSMTDYAIAKSLETMKRRRLHEAITATW